MPEAEHLRCNICDVVLEDAGKAKDHAATQAHTQRKSKLEESLKAVRGDAYAQDSSVILQWESSMESEGRQ